MKSMKTMLTKAGAMLLCFAMLGSAVISCSSAEDGANAQQTTADNMHDFKTSGDVSVSTGKTHTFLSQSVTDTPIVIGGRLKSTSPIHAAANRLRTSISTYTGIQPEVKIDALLGEEDPSAITEILIGETDRPESETVAKSLRINDYAIQVVNNKLVVIGGCEEKTVEAVNKLIELYFSADRADLVLECGYRYQYRYDYALSSLALNGKSVLDYTIVYGEGQDSVALYLQAALADAIGYLLPVASENAAEATEKEILVGASARTTSVKADAGTYRVGMDGAKLVFAGDDSTVLLGINAFIAQYVNGKKDAVKVEASLSLTGKPSYNQSVKLLTLNVGLSGYGDNAVVNRYPRLQQMVTAQAPDVLCLQEVSCTTWYTCLKEGIGDTPALLDTYGFVGTGRNGERPDRYEAFLEGAYNAILYNKAKYKLEDSGTFWLSDTPDVASVGWDGRTFSICTWAKLTDLASGEQFVVMNTQLDTYGRASAGNGAALICEKAGEFGLPVIIAGDFGSGVSGKPYKTVVADDFADTLKIAKTVVDSGATQNGYGSPDSTVATSHVFVTRGLCGVERYDLVTELVDGGYVAPNWAILTEIRY